MLALERSLWEGGASYVAGVDEAGRGALAGPVVAAAVILPRSMLIRGLNDSKQLTPAARDRLYVVISCAALGIGVGVVDHEGIDRENIRRANLRAMRQAVDALPLRPDHLLIDGVDCIDWPWPQTPVIDGDAKSLSVAAASVMAKVTRDRLMVECDQRYPGYGFARHKGYGTAEHIEAINQHGLCPIHRRSFRVTRHNGFRSPPSRGQVSRE
ncbi:MAG: ribonuclease HII [Candidatus Latescibacteria bacterium]|nr:ribonuclease HII [Candidatus Latescibacterota bacterium]